MYSISLENSRRALNEEFGPRARRNDSGIVIASVNEFKKNIRYKLSEYDAKYEMKARKGFEMDEDLSDDSEIPEEHEANFGHNEYLRQYKLKIKTITWNRDSEGLFDFDSRICYNQKLQIDKTCLLVRKDKEIFICDTDEDIKRKHQEKAQILMRIRKVRNHFEFDSVDTVKMEKMDDLTKQEYMKEDVDK